MNSRVAKKVSLVLALLLATVGVSAAVLKTFDYDYARLDKEFYLTDEQIAFVRPGLNIEVTDWGIAADGTITVDFTVTDDAGMPLDLNGAVTPGSIRISFLIARIPQGASTYQAYATRVQNSSITGESAEQPTSDSGGTITEVEPGTYTYTFGMQLPEGYDADATHTIGYYAERDLEEFGLGAPMDDGVITFVPSGGEVTNIREIDTNEACGQCHDFLRVHGRRHSVELCILCHTPGVIDPDTGNSVDFPVMIHKIHRGAGLPSVEAGEPYQIIGFRNSVHDYSNVHFPQDIRNCDTCHDPDAAQSDVWFENPIRSACGACHDSVNFATGAGHLGGPQVSDRFCANCHFPEGELEFDASIKGAHTIPANSSQLEGINIEILDVTNAGPGQTPTVLFTLANDAGEPIEPSSLSFFNLVMNGPTTDYGDTIVESARGAVPVGIAPGTGMMSAHEFSYTFTTPIPEEAEGTYAVGAEAFRMVTLNAGFVNEFSFRETAENPTFYFAVTGDEVIPRRIVVSDALCEDCHNNLALHGTIRHDATDYCQLCHTPTMDDSPYRPEDQMPARSINFPLMVHRIHMGEELTRDYTQIGHNGSINNYNHVRYPSAITTCTKCHVDETYLKSEGVRSTITLREFFSPMPPTTTACLGCHDSQDAAAHAFSNIAPFGEACMACHGEGRDFGVGLVHAE